MDVGKTAYYVAADAVGHTADLSQFSGQGLNGPDGSPLIHILGPNTRIVGDFSGSRCGNVVRHEASAVGSKTSLRLKATDFDIGGNGFPAIEVLAGEAEILPGYEIDLSGGKKAGSGDISWPIKTKPYSGVADASGNVSIIHGIVAAQDKMQTAKAAYKGSSSEWRPCNIEYVDGDVVRVTGASPLALVRVSLSFIDQPDPTW
ncbi:hypothetical protein YGS_C1P0346 [Sphingobium sp. YG1]|nr:hypothetical protein YGS_C1P0346 [Sphingobium sp. YG1]